MNEIIKYEAKDKKLFAEILSSEFNQNDIFPLFIEFRKQLRTAKCHEIIFNMSKISGNNFSAIGLLRACRVECSKIKYKLFISEAPPTLLEKLVKIGYNPETGDFSVVDQMMPRSVSMFVSFGNAAYKFYDDIISIINFVGDLSISIFYLIRFPNKIPVMETLYYIEKTGADAIPIVSLLCFLSGMILGFQCVVQMGK